MTRKKKKRRAYISCKGTRKIDYQKALNQWYIIIFTSDPADADFFIAPRERDGLTEKQKRELKLAEDLGISSYLVDSEALISGELDNPLNLSNEEIEFQEGKYAKEVAAAAGSRDKDYELELG